MLGHGLGYLFQMMLLDAAITPTSPYFDNGALLLQNISDGLWYFWRLDHDGAVLIDVVDQTPTAPPVGASSSIVFENQTDGLNYPVRLWTNDEGEVDTLIGSPVGAAGVASITLKDELAADHVVDMFNDPGPTIRF